MVFLCVFFFGGGGSLITCFYCSDIDGDGIISREDMSIMLDMITDTNMSDETKDQFVDGVYILKSH